MATDLGERRARAGLTDVLKRVLVGRAKPTHELEHTLLPKFLALPVFSSDPLSSNAYATEEMMLVLVTAGAAALSLMLPIAAFIALVLVIVVTSYRQTVRAYPRGGGSYIVARENLGKFPGLVAASAILTDYVLTVAVSMTAGTLAITSAVPELRDQKVLIALVLISLVMLANLRGAKEAGALFAIPTYGFVLMVYITIAMGLINCLDGCPRAETADLHLEPEHGLTLFLVLRAFSSGSTALTGVEAIADGVQAFRRPHSRNAATTLAVMASMTVGMFLGLTFLARALHVRVTEELALEKSVLAQIGETVFQGGPMFYVLQVFTALILILAANTAYQDFPRLSAILARDRFMPTQFRNRGDRLVFSNGIVVLSLLAILLVWVFDANLTRLIQLYVVGVFTAFTLSQAGMVRRWIRRKDPGWKRSAIINGIGATATGIVLVIVAVTKFTRGAWIVIAAMPVIILLMMGVDRHYASVQRQLRRGTARVEAIPRNTIVMVVTEFDAAASEALGYVRSLRAQDTRFLYLATSAVPPDLEDRWRELSRGDSRLEVLQVQDRHPGRAVRDYVRRIPRAPEDFVTVVVPEVIRSRGLTRYLMKLRPTTRVKFRLLGEPGIVVTNVPVQELEGQPYEVDVRPLIHQHTTVLVFVAAIHDATIRAVNYARSLRANDTRAVYFSTDPEDIEQIEQAWARSGLEVPLDIVGAPFRELQAPILSEVRRATHARSDAIAVVVLPEFVVSKWWHHILHGQTAFFVKRLLLFEPRVVLTSVPYHLE